MNELTKDFTVWMNEGFCGTYVKGSPERSSQLTKSLTLADGTWLSIQAGRSHYCSPRANSPTGDYNFYDTFEIGFPSQEIPEIMEYADNPEDPTETVYSQVPKEVIREVVRQRGGVVGYKEWGNEES